jgi:hypothetical protein
VAHLIVSLCFPLSLADDDRIDKKTKWIKRSDPPILNNLCSFTLSLPADNRWNEKRTLIKQMHAQSLNRDGCVMHLLGFTLLLAANNCHLHITFCSLTLIPTIAVVLVVLANLIINEDQLSLYQLSLRSLGRALSANT